MRWHLVQVARRLHEKGWAEGHAGNLSFREGEQFWITPKGKALSGIRVDGLVRVPLKGEAPPEASSEWRLHQAIYRLTAAECVLHAHPPCLVRRTLTAPVYQPATREASALFGSVPILEHEGPNVRDPESLLRSLEGPVVLLRAHGLVLWGAGFPVLLQWAEILEADARIQCA